MASQGVSGSYHCSISSPLGLGRVKRIQFRPNWLSVVKGEYCRPLGIALILHPGFALQSSLFFFPLPSHFLSNLFSSLIYTRKHFHWGEIGGPKTCLSQAGDCVRRDCAWNDEVSVVLVLFLKTPSFITLLSSSFSVCQASSLLYLTESVYLQWAALWPLPKFPFGWNRLKTTVLKTAVKLEVVNQATWQLMGPKLFCNHLRGCLR